MADNVVADAGTGGATFATDEDVGNSRHFPGSKIMLGVDGTFTSYWDGTVSLSATDNAVLDTINTAVVATQAAVEVIDNAIAGTEMQVDVVAALPAGANAIGTVSLSAVDNAVLDTINTAVVATQAAVQVMDDWDETNRAAVNTISGQIGVQGGTGVDTALTQRMSLATDIALPAGTNAIGKLSANSGVDIGDVDVLTLPNVNLAPQTAGGLSIHRRVSLATVNSTDIKGSAGQVYGWYLSNINAAIRYLKLYNQTTAPTSAHTPVMTIGIPGNTAGVAGHVEFTQGIPFATGIAMRLTSDIGDASTGAVSADELIVNLLYK